MKLINKSKRNYVAFDTILVAGQIIEVNEATAKILLAQPDVEKYIDEKEVAKLEEENELNKLKLEAMELGIKFSKQIGIKKLKEKIEKFKKDKEKEEVKA